MLANAVRLITTPSELRNRIVRVYIFLFAINLSAWALAIAASVQYPILLPTALLAYTFGLRHAVDADHIAAIDNTTRKLMQDGQRPVGVGLFFSLGHATIVLVLSVLIALSAGVVSDIPAFKDIGSLIATSASAAFLLVIGLINLAVLLDICRMFRRVSQGEAYDEQSLDDYLQNRGLLAQLLRPALRLIRRSWDMYPLGVLFGLGFDTASEVAVLGFAATSGANHVPIYFTLVLPALFAAGMSLVDATDGIMMLGAYGWAYAKPIRKLYYNLNITLVSVLVAFLIGGIEVLSMVGDRSGLTGGIWDLVGGLDFEIVGFGVIAIFVLSLGVSTFIYWRRGYDDMPVVITSGVATN